MFEYFYPENQSLYVYKKIVFIIQKKLLNKHSEKPHIQIKINVYKS